METEQVIRNSEKEESFDEKCTISSCGMMSETEGLCSIPESQMETEQVIRNSEKEESFDEKCTTSSCGMMSETEGLCSIPESQMETEQVIRNSEKEDESLEKCTTSSCGMMSETEGLCSICLKAIALQETALIKGCEHAYCVTCILRWAADKKNPSCPQCKQSFEFLIVHRSLDGSIHDYMFEESICLLLRATWFKPLKVEAHKEEAHEQHDYQDEYDSDDYWYLDKVNTSSSSSLRIGNRMWVDNDFVRGHKKERYDYRRNFSDLDAGPSGGSKNRNGIQNTIGRRAKRTLKREAADRAVVAASKNQQHSPKLGDN